MGAREALELATLGGAQVLGRDDIGALTVGRRADIAIWDLGGIDSAGVWDPVAALVLAGPMRVRDLLVEGRKVVVNQRVMTIDTDQVIRQQTDMARALAADL